MGTMPRSAPGAALRVQATGTLCGRDLRWPARPWPAPSAPRRWPQTPARATHSAPLQVDDELCRPGGQVEEGDRAGDRQDAGQDLEREDEPLGGGCDWTDPEQDRLPAGKEEEVDEHHARSRSAATAAAMVRTRGEARQPPIAGTMTAATTSRAGPISPPGDHRDHGRDGGERRLGERVEPMVGARSGPAEKSRVRPGRGVAIAQTVPPATRPGSSRHGSPSSSSRSPCGKRAFVRRAIAERMR